MMKEIKKIQDENPNPSLLRQWKDDPALYRRACEEARQRTKLAQASYDDSWFRRPGYSQCLGLDGEVHWVADTPDMERQRALEKTLSAQGVPDEVIETVLWVNDKIANEPHAREPEPKPKRKSRGGRQPSIKPDQITRGIGILRSRGKMKNKDAYRLLRSEGIEGSDPAMYRLILSRARDVSK
jgi:hypothetical protein